MFDEDFDWDSFDFDGFDRYDYDDDELNEINNRRAWREKEEDYLDPYKVGDILAIDGVEAYFDEDDNQPIFEEDGTLHFSSEDSIYGMDRRYDASMAEQWGVWGEDDEGTDDEFWGVDADED